MKNENSCVAIYNTHEEAEQAVKDLQKAGFDMKKLSIVGKGYHTEEEPLGYYDVGDRVMFWGKQGAFWGGLWGLLMGAGFFWIPAFGPLVVAGPISSAIIGALEGAALTGGMTALGAAIYSIGIPRESVIKYETAVKADQFLLIVHGTQEEVKRARDILKTGSGDVTVHLAT